MTDLTKKEIKVLLREMQIEQWEVERAIVNSIEHWKKDILDRLKKDEIFFLQEDSNDLCWKSDDSKVQCFASACPLCKLFLFEISSSVYSGCMYCPYRLFHDHSCNDRFSSWVNFTKEPTKENAKQMIKELKNTLKFWRNLK
jgi:hypothetical protein